jgi:hypothetical protein
VCLPQAIAIVSSSVFIPITEGERSLGDGFPPGETIRFGSLEFIADQFSGLSLSPLGGGSGAVIMVPARSGPSLLQQTMMGSPIEGFPMAPGREGWTDLPFPGRHDAESPPTSKMTIPQPENPPTDQAMTTFLPQ